MLIESNNGSSSVKAISTEAQWKAIKLVENDEIVSSTLSDNKRAAAEKIVERSREECRWRQKRKNS